MGKYIELLENLDKQQEQVQEFMTKIKKDCKPFLKLKTMLYRGMRNQQDTGLIKPQKNRKPLNTHPIYDAYLNIMLNNAGVTPRSEGTFCKTNESSVRQFGIPYFIFPKGKFELYYLNGIEDLTYDLRITTASYGIKGLIKNEALMKDIINAKSKKDFMKSLETATESEKANPNYNSFFNDIKERLEQIDNLEKAIVKNKIPSENYEIVLDCKEYYFIRESTYITHSRDEKYLF